MYVVVDIETTGAYSQRDGITEVGAILTDGEKILDEYHSLVNPGENIPRFITTLTGIDNEMLEDAPYFEEIVEDLFSFLDGYVFVAHNVHFDYNFIRNAFERHGKTYNSRRLCTVRLSRKLIAEAPGYSLSKITRFLGINNDSPHRALGDARATTELLWKLISNDESGVIDQHLKRNSHETILPLNVNKKDFTELPFKPGVYFFMDEKGKIIYIGKAKNLKKRVSSHFSGTPNSRRRHHFHTEICKIDHEVTGSELIAALREDELIRKHWPKYNKAQKNRVVKFGVFKYEDQNGVVRLGIQKNKVSSDPVKSFYSEWEAKNWLMEMVKEYGLNSVYCGLPEFLNQCSDKRHNKTVNKFLNELKNEEISYAFIEEGRNRSEKCLVLVENDMYKGFGYVSSDDQILNKEEVREHIRFGNNSATSHSIVASFVAKNSPEIIPL
ncbi:MAG: GIY-YIG nuclease family protein [Flavobacteriales bacterium]|nr:GIY-YIG nuclease family protein [Flavobacteriales bacterium]